MSLTRRMFVTSLAGAGLAAMSLPIARGNAEGTPPGSMGCAAPSPVMGDHGGMDHGSMGHGTPMAGPHDAEIDQMYIDMMLPHHGSIIALAETALPLLSDERLIAMAEDIIETQRGEQTLMQALREEWYGSPEPEPMSHDMMNITMGHGLCAPGEMDMDNMMNVMDADWQVETFLAADDPDLAFIEQTIPHHQMAIDSSEVALLQAVHPELKEIAQDVIEAQQQEIDLLETIQAELTGEATPTA